MGGRFRSDSWCGLVDGRMLELRWMVDENGRPQSVTFQRYQDMLQQCIGGKSKVNGAVGVTGLCKMEQRLTQATSTSTFSVTNFKEE